MNLKLVETLLIAFIPLFSTTTAAHVAAEGAVRPEHEVEGKIRGSDNKGAEDFLADLLEKDKPKPLKGADGGLTANHAHGGRMLAKGGDEDPSFAIGAGYMAVKMVDQILQEAGVNIAACVDDATPLSDDDVTKITCLIGTVGYAALTILCDKGITDKLCMQESVARSMAPLTEKQQDELFQVAREIFLSTPASASAESGLFTAPSAPTTTTTTKCKIETVLYFQCYVFRPGIPGMIVCPSLFENYC